MRQRRAESTTLAAGAEETDTLPGLGGDRTTSAVAVIALDVATVPAFFRDVLAGAFGLDASLAGTAQDGSDRVIYNTSSGELWYDADGSGSGGAQLIATVQAGSAIAATDIVVI